MAPATSDLTEQELQFYELAGKFENGVDTEQIQEHMPGLSVEEIANMVNKLARKSMIEMCHIGSKLAYRAIRSEEQAKMAMLSADELMVYRQIKAAGNEGIWTRTINRQTNLHQQVVTRCIKSMESKGLIKSVKSIKNPTRKLYMLTEMKPSQELTGGPWYTDQDLDVEFINTLGQQIYKYIYSKSFPRHLPDSVFSAQHTAYPTTSQIRRYITENQISTVELGNKHIQELLDMLVFDGKIERVLSTVNMAMWNSSASAAAGSDVEGTYRAIRLHPSESPLTDIPCGRCPVSRYCSETGHISPSNCRYYREWLQF